MMNPSASDLLNIEIVLNSAAWEVGIAVAPTLEGCEANADDDGDTSNQAEVR